LFPVFSFLKCVCYRCPEADLGMFSMFGRTGALRNCRTLARHFLSCGVGPIYVVLRHLKHVSTECFRTLMPENLCEGAEPHIFTEQSPIGFKSGPAAVLSSLVALIIFIHYHMVANSNNSNIIIITIILILMHKK